MLNTKPAGKRTGYANPDCYARALSDCDQEVTKEHYISKKLLLLMGEFDAAGLSWLPEKKILKAKALQSYVLCKRHNNALSPLDDNITKLYDMMRRWQDRKPVGKLVLDGEDLERWAIKVMFGLFASGSTRKPGDNTKQAGTPAIPRRHLRILFGDSAMPKGAGFYFSHSIFGDLRPTAVRCRVDWNNTNALSPDSIVFSLVGFTWTTILIAVAPYPHLYRPSDFDIGDTGELTPHWNCARREVKHNPRIKLFEMPETDGTR